MASRQSDGRTPGIHGSKAKRVIIPASREKEQQRRSPPKEPADDRKSLLTARMGPPQRVFSPAPVTTAAPQRTIGPQRTPVCTAAKAAARIPTDATQLDMRPSGLASGVFKSAIKAGWPMTPTSSTRDVGGLTRELRAFNLNPGGNTTPARAPPSSTRPARVPVPAPSSSRAPAPAPGPSHRAPPGTSLACSSPAAAVHHTLARRRLQPAGDYAYGSVTTTATPTRSTPLRVVTAAASSSFLSTHLRSGGSDSSSGDVVTSSSVTTAADATVSPPRDTAVEAPAAVAAGDVDDALRWERTPSTAKATTAATMTRTAAAPAAAASTVEATAVPTTAVAAAVQSPKRTAARNENLPPTHMAAKDPLIQVTPTQMAPACTGLTQMAGQKTPTHMALSTPTHMAQAGTPAAPVLGSVQVFSAVKANRAAKEKLGSDVVLTPVRRSARKGVANPTTPVSALLEATNFAYAPNAYLSRN